MKLVTKIGDFNQILSLFFTYLDKKAHSCTVSVIVSEELMKLMDADRQFLVCLIIDLDAIDLAQFSNDRDNVTAYLP